MATTVLATSADTETKSPDSVYLQIEIPSTVESAKADLTSPEAHIGPHSDTDESISVSESPSRLKIVRSRVRIVYQRGRLSIATHFDRDSKEIWIVDPDFPDYFVSSKGRMMTKYGYLMKSAPNCNGYIHPSTTDREGKTYTKGMHIHVARGFIPNPENKPFVNHINGIRHDNDVCNLEWVTAEENAQRQVFRCRKQKECQIVQYDTLGAITHIWSGKTEVEEAFGTQVLKQILKACKSGVYVEDSQWRRLDDIDLPGENWATSQYQGESIQVSSLGRIMCKNGKRTFGSKRKSGYVTYHDAFVHRLICYGFYPRADADSLVVDHIDRNRSNNNISNLEWITQSENMRRAHERAKFKDNKNRRPVAHWFEWGEYIASYPSITEASQATGVPICSISKACYVGTTATTGHFWRFI